MGETLRQALAKLVMRSSGDQTKTACGNLQPCAGLKTGIEAGTHALKQQILERGRERRRAEEEAEELEEEEEEGGGDVESLNNLNIVNAGTEEELAEGLKAALGMAAREMEVEEDRRSEGEEKGGGLKGHWEPLRSSLRKLSRM